MSGATLGAGSATQADRVSAWGRRPLGRLAFGLLNPRPGGYKAGGYQAWVRAQCGQPTEVVTSASKT
jgi:hypothetical protein